MNWSEIVICIILGVHGIAFTFFPLQLSRLIYLLVEWQCTLSGNDCKEVLEYRFKNLKNNPKEYAETHWGTILMGRFIGVFILMVFGLCVNDFLSH